MSDDRSDTEIVNPRSKGGDFSGDEEEVPTFTKESSDIQNQVTDETEKGDGEELDDLFGDDDEEEQSEIKRPANGNRIVSDSDEDDFVKDDDDQFTVQPEIKELELKTGNLDIIRHPPKFQSDPTSEKESLIYTAAIPKFLKFDPARFDGRSYIKNFEDSVKNQTSDELELKKLVDENTIRWRFTKKSQEASSLKAESNTQIIEWEDGSLSLKLGSEIFDIIQSDLIDTGLVTSGDVSKSLEAPTVYLADGLIQKGLKVIPTSTKSAIHKKLTHAIQSRQYKAKPGARTVVVEVDPDKEARLLEKQQEEKIRERRRLQQKLDRENSRGNNGAGNSASPHISSRYSQGESYSRTRDEYEQDDGFLVDDEEDVDFDEVDEDEEEEDDDDIAADRLRRIKEDGAAQYKRSSNNEDGDEDDSNEADNENKGEAEESSRKKRRVIEDDDDDE